MNERFNCSFFPLTILDPNHIQLNGKLQFIYWKSKPKHVLTSAIQEEFFLGSFATPSTGLILNCEMKNRTENLYQQRGAASREGGGVE